jgi:hypothetical protein
MALEDVSTVDTIRDLKNQDPFSPFKIVMASGDKHLIEDPDALAIGTSQLFYYPRKPKPGVHLRTDQITAVEDNRSRSSVGKRCN